MNLPLHAGEPVTLHTAVIDKVAGFEARKAIVVLAPLPVTRGDLAS